MGDISAKDLDEELESFEKRIDTRDPEQLKLLDAMREHTRRLHQLRGDWNKPTNVRNWNDPTPRPTSSAPLAIASYRYLYMNHTHPHPLLIILLVK